MNRIYKNIRLRYIFILIVVLLMILLFAIQSTFTITQVSGLVSIQVNQASEAMLGQVSARIKERFEDYSSVAKSVLINFNVIDQISNLQNKSLFEEIKVHDTINSYFQNLKYSRMDIAEILLVVDETKVDNYQQSGLISRKLLQEQDMYTYIKDSNSGFIPTGKHLMEVTNKQQVFSYFIKGYQECTGEFIVIVSIYEDRVKEILRDAEGESIIFLTNDNGEIISPYEVGYTKLAVDIANEDLKKRKNDKYRSINYANKDYLYLEEPIDNSWKIVQMQKLSHLEQGIHEINQRLLILIVLGMLFGVLYINYMIKGITIPIQKLIRQMKNVGQGDFNIYIDHSYSNEIGELNAQFEEMVKEINYLLKKTDEDNQKLRISELKALQMQINPHFLYNTLNAINWMALNYGVDDISSMVVDLSQLFRLSLNSGRENITIRLELEHLKSYLNIQSYRYNNSFDCIYDIDENILEYTTIKIILQPFVENALIHGLKKTKGMGTINITATAHDEEILFTIADDGCGANPDILNDLLIHQKENQNSYGIKNVNDRLKIYYGDTYGVHYLKVDKGTAVQIRIPKNDREVEQNV